MYWYDFLHNGCKPISMKNIFYLSIFAIIAFSSCKGISFENRRYTHFSNKQNKGSNTKVVTNNNKKQQTINQSATLAQKVNEIHDETPTIALVATTDIQKTSVVNSPYKFRALAVTTENSKTISSNGSDYNNSVVDKTTNSSSYHAFKAKALIGELLSLVLYIILLCILIGAIITLAILL